MFDHGFGLGGGEDTSVDLHGADNVWVDVGGGSSVLDVALSVGVGGAGWDAEGGSSVSDSEGEFSDVGSFMLTGHSLLVIITVEGDVEVVFVSELLHHVVDVVHALGALSHGLGGEVGVAAGAVPVWEELGGEGDAGVVVLSDAGKNVPGHHEVVTHLKSEAWSNLVLPLTWHNLSVGTRNVDAGGEASAVVLVGDDSAEGDVGTDGAVVGSLWAWVTVGWPAKWPFCELVGSSEESEFLLDSEPWLLSGGELIFEDGLGEVAEVGVGGDELLAGSVLPLEGLGHDQDVVSSSEGIGEVGDWFHSNLGLLGGGLVAGRSVVVPIWEIGEGLDLLLESAALGAEGDAGSVNPDVFSDDLATLVGDLGEGWVLVVKYGVFLVHLEWICGLRFKFIKASTRCDVLTFQKSYLI